MTVKQDRLAVLIQKYISDIIQFELKSKEVGLATVTRVKVSDDNSWAKVFVSFLADNKEEHLEALKRSKGFIRSSLAKKLTIRKTPDINFVIDDSYEKGEKIESILRELRKEN